MKNLKTLITLFLLVIGMGTSWADVTCTWDFTNPSSEAAKAAFEYIGVTSGKVPSDVAGVELLIETKIEGAKFNSADRHASGKKDVQINAGTVIKVPVKTNQDEIVITNYKDKNYRISYYIGNDEIVKIGEYVYEVTDFDVKSGYVDIEVKENGYALKIAVTHCDATPTSAEERTATWDFRIMAQDAVNIVGSVGSVNSEIEGVALDVDASNGGKLWSRGTDAQFNGGAIIKVPVRHVGDVVTVESYPGCHNYTIAGSVVDADHKTYVAQEADVAKKSVSIVASNADSYLYYISVKQIAYSETTDPAEEEESVDQVTAIWYWKKPAEGSVTVIDTNVKYEFGYVRADIETLSLEVNAKNAEFVMENSGNVKAAFLSNGGVIRVPVRRAGDVITITCPPGQDKYDIGGLGNVKTYNATTSDAEVGYVEIKAVDDTRFWEIKVVQEAFKSIIPMIKFNSAGWASYTSLLKNYVVYLPKTAQAYVATSVDYEDDNGSVTLTPVDRFAYGEGVFIKSAPYAEVFAKVTTTGTSNVPAQTGAVRTQGCTTDLPLYDESNAFVIATNNAGAKPVAGFFRVKDTIICPAGKAFLYVEDASSAKSLSFKFEDGSVATGIESVVADAETKVPTVFYNLSGQAVSKDYKGIVIGNDGKKYVK